MNWSVMEKVSMIDNGNFISRFIENADNTPDKIALQLPQMEGQRCVAEDCISYGELSALIAAYQHLWLKKGWKAGDRIIVILKPSKELYAIALSLFSLGIVAVFIDTGMGRKKIQMAIRDSNASATMSMQALIKLFWFVPALWRLKRYSIDGSGLGYRNIIKQVDEVITNSESRTLTAIERSATDHGLISFTSGSTGRPKGADRTHFSLIQQHLAIRDHWQDDIDDIDCPCFPVMVLHNLSCGMTTIMPKVDLAKPSEVNAKVVIEQIRQHKITRLSGAPAYINQLVDCVLNENHESNPKVQELKSLVVGGATVSKELAEKIRRAFPNANARIVYGSTEAEPISDVSIDEYLMDAELHRDEANTGYLVGHIAPQIDLLISDFSVLELEKVAQGGLLTETDLLSCVCDQGAIGEILVSGNHVLKQYIDNPKANQENKIPRENVAETKAVWHRTGDCGYQDKQGRLWLSGRVKDIIQVNNHTFQPYPIEQSLDVITGIHRSAVLSYKGKAHIFIQLDCDISTREHQIQHSVLDTVSVLLSAFGIHEISYIEVAKIPLDGRHNSKIDRPQLRLDLKNNAFKNARLLRLNLLG
jgi:acyl-CoA synthetase (AMP-forming)/AMP-acid ligase II